MQEGRLILHQKLLLGTPFSTKTPLEILPAHLGQTLIQLLQVPDLGHGNKEIEPHVLDDPLNYPLLVALRTRQK